MGGYKVGTSSPDVTSCDPPTCLQPQLRMSGTAATASHLWKGVLAQCVLAIRDGCSFETTSAAFAALFAQRLPLSTCCREGDGEKVLKGKSLNQRGTALPCQPQLFCPSWDCCLPSPTYVPERSTTLGNTEGFHVSNCRAQKASGEVGQQEPGEVQRELQSSVLGVTPGTSTHQYTQYNHLESSSAEKDLRVLVDTKLTMTSDDGHCGKDGHQPAGLHQAERGQQVEGGHPAPLLSTGETQLGCWAPQHKTDMGLLEHVQ
ncbi:LOW QUALITY PROTEIN: hypothetical protein QYF61_013024 [Mycteria americana]|uniref:Uncharacterized protein n=1 Tax=Mycteria americana TaxID=33587 RepID=A0AAN7NUR3_MYCAM|nr:LOW QUALITY PROTEIN: hypothetical protein QYF61_013024 [Mycteria americana]